MDSRRLTRDIVLFTLGLEAVGAVVLFAAFLPHMPWGDAARHALFQSVSAFCNAGFSTFSDSREGWAAYGFVTWHIMLLIVVGGIGFLTLEELDQLRRQRKGVLAGMTVWTKFEKTP